jgi:hypothetical protein
VAPDDPPLDGLGVALLDELTGGVVAGVAEAGVAAGLDELPTLPALAVVVAHWLSAFMILVAAATVGKVSLPTIV